MDRAHSFVELLYSEAPREAFDAALADAVKALKSGPGLDQLRREHATSLRLLEQMERRRQREAELSALYDTANDLTGIRDVDAILTAIVRRARQLLHADMTYLSLNDEADGASYMKVTDGSVSTEFRNLRLPLGAGLLGLVAPIIALQLLGSVEEKNTTAVAIYVSVASVISIIAVLFAKETVNTSLRHDRVLEDARTSVD